MFLYIMQITCTKPVTQSSMLKENPTLEKLLYYGTLAPSTHNAQMWKVKILSKNEFIIIFDSERALKYVDSDNREALISIGAFLGNVIRGSEAMGIKLHYTVYDEIEPDNSVVYVSFEEVKSKNSSDSIQKYENLLLKRKSSKEKFSNKRISPQEIDEITKGYKDNTSYLSKDNIFFNYIRENTIKAYEIQGKNLDKRNELSEWFRFSDKETKLKKDGMNAEMLGMGSLKKFFYYNFYNGEKVKDIKFLDKEISLLEKQVNSADGFLLVITKDNSVKENISAGVILENIWLNAAEKDIKIQPLSQILEEYPLKNNINNDLKINGEVKMILRLGYSSNNGKINKVRRSVEDILDNVENQNLEEKN